MSKIQKSITRRLVSKELAWEINNYSGVDNELGAHQMFNECRPVETRAVIKILIWNREPLQLHTLQKKSENQKKLDLDSLPPHRVLWLGVGGVYVGVQDGWWTYEAESKEREREREREKWKGNFWQKITLKEKRHKRNIVEMLKETTFHSDVFCREGVSEDRGKHKMTKRWMDVWIYPLKRENAKNL
jgi:hypothetical protein